MLQSVSSLQLNTSDCRKKYSKVNDIVLELAHGAPQKEAGTTSCQKIRTKSLLRLM